MKDKIRQFSRVIFTNPDNDILVIQEKRNPEPLWALPGGKLEVNETPIHTAKREVKEEIDASIDLYKLKFVTRKLCMIGNQKWEGFFYHYPVFPINYRIKESKILQVEYKPLSSIVGLNAYHDALYNLLSDHKSKTVHNSAYCAV